MLESRKVVALHCIPLTPGEKDDELRNVSQDYIKNLYPLKEFVMAFNKTFINFGLDPEKFDFEHYPFMKDFVAVPRDTFCIIVLRLN
jgi:hypothetical protein